ncbi:MAG TPA: hypothetical protein VNK04_08925 [Gemmataceae bacterium]|jgi:hypothetical protein|nr:hypothetical protein [Gemmataceae bacterium]
MNIRFDCPECGWPRRADLPGSAESRCPFCDHLLPLPAELGREPLPLCASCGNHELYKKKDFPHWLGISILTAACLAFLVLMGLYRPWWAWAVLLGSAAFDGLLYLWVGDVVVCYRCGAEYRGFPPNPGHGPFELGIGERYRQERIRREQLKLTARRVENQ